MLLKENKTTRIVPTLIFILILFISKKLFAQDLENIPKIVKEKSKITSNDEGAKEVDLDAIENAIFKINKKPKTKKKYKFKSLMFSSQEINNIKKILNSKDLVKNKPTIQKTEAVREVTTFGKIYLSSILYLSENSWSIWINSNKISSRNNSELDEIYIKSVTPYEVKLVWSLSPSKWRIISGLLSNAVTPALNHLGQIEINISLKSNQTYILKRDEVVNGKI